MSVCCTWLLAGDATVTRRGAVRRSRRVEEEVAVKGSRLTVLLGDCAVKVGEEDKLVTVSKSVRSLAMQWNRIPWGPTSWQEALWQHFGHPSCL